MSGTAIFGRLGGAPVPAVTFGDDHGASATVIGFGASLQDLVIPGRHGPQRVVLGLSTLENYVRHGKSFGAVVGRYANRIGRARFTLDGREHHLLANAGANTLHGGPDGFGVRAWQLAESGPDHCRFVIESPDGDGGFPGAVRAVALYRFVGPGRLRIVLEAETDAPTPLNLTCHAYFNLDGSTDMRAHHRLRAAASLHLSTDPDGVPTGAIEPVDGTRFDFRQPRAPTDLRGPLDATLVLDRSGDCGPDLREAATLLSDKSRVSVTLSTTEPGLQAYDSSTVNLDMTDLDGRPLRPFCGLALEAQRFPDAPNHPHFPACTLRPGERSRQETEFAFGVAERTGREG